MNSTAKYCCSRFEESVREEEIVRSDGYDETDWYIPEGFHIYYCPFCGTNIKGQGFGKYDEEQHKK